MMANGADDIVNAVKSPWKKVYDLANKIPGKKTEYTDMHAKNVEKANESFRKQADEKNKKKVSNGDKPTTQRKIQASSKKSTQKKVASTKR
jgi:hypothetical protein